MARGRFAFASSLLAVAAGAALLVAAFTVPMYASDPPGGPDTLVGVNGVGVVIPVGIPLVLAVLAFGGLHALCKRGSTIGERAAVIAFATLFVFTILAGFSIGLLVLPITALVGAALVLTPEP